MFYKILIKLNWRQPRLRLERRIGKRMLFIIIILIMTIKTINMSIPYLLSFYLIINNRREEFLQLLFIVILFYVCVLHFLI